MAFKNKSVITGMPCQKCSPTIHPKTNLEIRNNDKRQAWGGGSSSGNPNHDPRDPKTGNKSSLYEKRTLHGGNCMERGGKKKVKLKFSFLPSLLYLKAGAFLTKYYSRLYRYNDNDDRVRSESATVEYYERNYTTRPNRLYKPARSCLSRRSRHEYSRCRCRIFCQTLVLYLPLCPLSSVDAIYVSTFMFLL